MPAETARLHANTDEAVRDNLKDLVNLASGLANLCHTTQELCEVCELALRNDAQLAMVMTIIKQNSQQQRR